MSYREFLYWQAFDQLEPIGVSREDLLFGNIAKTIADIKIREHGLSLEDFMLFKQKQERTVEDVCDDIKSRMASFM